jgi:hypothetical protein
VAGLGQNLWAKGDGQWRSLHTFDFSRPGVDHFKPISFIDIFATQKPPTSGFLLSPESELLGDVCFFLNMLLFNNAWNLLTLMPFGRVGGVGEFFGRLFYFHSLLCWFTSRHECPTSQRTSIARRTVDHVVANSPVISKS